MRVATWNLDRCAVGEGVRATWLRDQMAQVVADVWILTETHRDFAPGQGFRLAAYSADAPDREAARGECWVAIWTREQTAPVTLTRDTERAAAVTLTGPGGTPVVIVGTVLPWLADGRDPAHRGEAAFRARLADQAADWRRLLQAAGSGLCVAGDFNQDLLAAGHYYGSAGGRVFLRETLAELGLVCLTGGVDDPLKGTHGLAAIDHICVGGHLRGSGMPQSSAWPPPGELPRRRTDHYGVWADLACPEK